MASNDSGVDTSNDSNDMAIMNTMSLPIIWHKEFDEGFAFPKPLSGTEYPQRPANSNNISTIENTRSQMCLPSSSHERKMRLRDCVKHRYTKTHNIMVLSRDRRLRLAASTGNLGLLSRQLEAGANPNSSDEHKRSPLHLASCRGYTDIVSQLLKYRADPNQVDSLGNTPLHLAVISASSTNFNLVVRILLQGGANVHLVDRTGKNPLELAESKLILMRARYKNPTKEKLQTLEDMCILIALILRHFCKQKKDIDELAALEDRLKQLNTNEQVVSEADSLLASVERLSINK